MSVEQLEKVVSSGGKSIFKKPFSLRDVDTHYCPGCGHGIIHRIIAEVVDELNIKRKVIGIAPVGCAVLAYDYWDFDCLETPHGRGLASATAMKRLKPENIIFTYQGDGDLAAIGTGETLHAANRGENLTCIFVNNGCYGMTGGQLAPTTILGQKTLTTPRGRDPLKGDGWPLKITELIAQLEGSRFVARAGVFKPQEVKVAYQYIKKSFLNQIEGRGFSLVEVLSPCPPQWHKSPQEAMEYIEKEVLKIYPLGIIKDTLLRQ